MSPGYWGSHSTGCGLPVSEFSNTVFGKWIVEGFLPPVASATAQSIARRPWSFCVETVISLNVGFAAVVRLPEAPEHVAVRRRQCRDRAPALLELGQSADEGRAEVRDDDVDLWILGNVSRENLLRQGRIPVRHLERLCSDERVLVCRVEDLVETLVLLEALAVARGAAEHQYVAPLRQHLLNPAPHSCPAWTKLVSMKTL